MRTSTASKKSAATKAATAKKTAKPTAAKTKQKSSASQESMEEQTPFEKLFTNMLKDIYWAEQALVDALKKMSAAATTDALQSAFEDHLFITQKHVSRLERVFASLGMEAEGKQCDAMVGLIKEAEHVMEETEDGSMTRDAGLIIAAQKVEHYEIASYGSLVQVAITLGHEKEAQILDKTLREEEETDLLLTEIAETEVNPMADQESGEEEEGAEEEQETEEEE